MTRVLIRRAELWGQLRYRQGVLKDVSDNESKYNSHYESKYDSHYESKYNSRFSSYIFYRSSYCAFI
jgi:hypothetical protein